MGTVFFLVILVAHAIDLLRLGITEYNNTALERN